MEKKKNGVVDELTRIANKHNGLLRPADVIEAARPVGSPLHTRFTWDDTEAAHQYRLWQAREIIRVSVEYLPPQLLEDEVNKMTAFKRKYRSWFIGFRRKQRQGEARRGKAGQGRAGQAGQGKARQGRAGQARTFPGSVQPGFNIPLDTGSN